MASLEKRFARCFRSIQADADPGAIGRLFADLDARYREPVRRYHNRHHIERCLELFDEYSYLADTPRPVELAIWYHDSVYVPGDPDNELESARLAEIHASTLSIPGPIVATIRELIMATRHLPGSDRSEPATPGLATRRDHDLIIDIDLSILGGDPDEYDDYARGIRAEYRHIENPVFKTGRAGVLRTFLGADTLYRTPEFRTRFQKNATLNMKRELESLI